MPVERDQFWEYVEVIDDKRWKCLYCDQEFSGKAPRIKAHLGKVPRMGIRPCKSNSLDEDVSSAAKAALKQKDPIDKDGEGPAQSMSKRQRLESNTQPLSIGSSIESRAQGPNQPADRTRVEELPAMIQALQGVVDGRGSSSQQETVLHLTDHVRVQDVAAAIHALQRVIAGQCSRSQQTIHLTDHIRVEGLTAAMPALQRVIAGPGSSSQQETTHHLTDLFEELPEHQRSDAVNSMVYEANARVRDPVYGCVGAISLLQHQNALLQRQLAATQAEVVLRLGQCSSDLNLATNSQETASPSPRRLTSSQSRSPFSEGEDCMRLIREHLLTE